MFTTLQSLNKSFDPFSIGFDRVIDEMLEVSKTVSKYPPYNIKQLSEDNYKIEMAVAGFSKEDLRVELHNNQLTIEGSKVADDQSSKGSYVYRGIAGRQFRQTFALADHVKVIGSELKDGILTVELERDLPEEKKPRIIEVK